MEFKTQNSQFKIQRSSLLAALLSAALFGAATPLSKILLQTVAPAQLAGLLYLGAAVGLLPVAFRGTRTAGAPLERRGVLGLLGAIVFGGILAPLLLLFGLRLASATSVSLWLNMELVATAGLGRLVFREHLGRAAWISVGIVAGAGAMLSGSEGPAGVAAAILVTAACVCWAVDNHLTALIDGFTVARATFWKCAVAGSVNLLLAGAATSFQWSPSVMPAALLVGAVSYGASIVLYVGAAQQLGATRAQLVFATAPFFGVALSLWLLGESASTAQVTAGVLMVAALALTFATRHEHPHTHAGLGHTHLHRHDDGHHDHPHQEDGEVPLLHAHWHTHEPVEHAHPHLPDLHHRHGHG